MALKDRNIILDWRFEEGSGTNVDDLSSFDNDGVVVYDAGYPLWIPGYESSYALRFNGGNVTSPEIFTSPERVYSEDTLVCDRYLGVTVVCAFRTTATTQIRALFGAFKYDLSNPTLSQEMGNGLYIVNGRVYYGEQFTSGGGGATWRFGVKSDSSALNDGEWHVAVGRSSEISATDATIPRVLDLWIDKVKQTETLTVPMNVYNIHALSPLRALAGYGQLNRPYASSWFPGTGSSFNGDGTFNGDIDFCQFYCDYVEDDEIPPQPPPEVINAIMFSCNT